MNSGILSFRVEGSRIKTERPLSVSQSKAISAKLKREVAKNQTRKNNKDLIMMLELNRTGNCQPCNYK